MNILHHKSWHVRNKDNIQRVRRDEAKAAEEEKQKQKRKEIAESEARVNLLRSKSVVAAKYDSNEKHINFFKSEEYGKAKNEKNSEVEHEKKQEQEKFEKKIGLLKYLVDDNDLDPKTKPWYKSHQDKNESSDTELDLKRKLDEDPLSQIDSIMKDHEKKKKKKIKREKEKSIEPSPVKRSKTIEELRAERLKRESEERLKADRLLYGFKEPGKSTVELDDRKRKYNNQFNPEISKY